jgi:hypothetical protein
MLTTMRRRLARWFDTAMGRGMFVLLVVWITFMLVGLIQFMTGGGPWGFVMATGLVGWVFLMIYLVPRASNWVRYRKWDARTDHYRDSATDGGSTEGEK